MSALLCPMPEPLTALGLVEFISAAARAASSRHHDLSERLDRLEAAAAHHDEAARRAGDAWQAARAEGRGHRAEAAAFWAASRACEAKVLTAHHLWGYVWQGANTLAGDIRATRQALVGVAAPAVSRAPAGLTALHIEQAAAALDVLDTVERLAAGLAPIALTEWRRNGDLSKAVVAERARVHTAIDKAWRQWFDPRGRSGIAPLPMPEEIAVYAARWAIHRYGGETAPKKAGSEAQRMVKEWRAMRGDRTCLWDVGRAGSLASGLVRPGEQERHADLLHALFVRAAKYGDW